MNVKHLRAAVVLAALAAPLAARATPLLEVEAVDGASPVTLIVTTSTTGILLSSGSDGTLAASVDVFGAQNSNGGLNTATIDATGSAGTVLTLTVTQTGLSAAGPSQDFALSFTTNGLTAQGMGSTSFTDYVGPANDPFGTADRLFDGTLAVTGSVVNASVAQGTAAGLTPGGSYSETQVIRITFGASGSISADSQMIPMVPEPASLTLLGLALSVLLTVHRRGTIGV